MTQKLVSRTEFAKLAGVNPSTVTRLCSTLLKAAANGKRVDAHHPDAVAYLAGKARDHTPAPAEGIDPLYGEAIRIGKETGRYSITNLQRKLKIGYNRAARIVEMMKAAGVIPKPGSSEVDAQPEPAPTTPHVRGTAAAKQKMKQAPPPPPIDPDEYLLEVPEDIRAFADMSLRQLVERFGTDTRFVDWLVATKRIEDINGLRLKNSAIEGTLISRQLVKTGVIDVFDSAHRRLMTDGAKSLAAGVASKVASGASLDEVEAYVADIVGSFLRPTKNKIARALKNVKA